MSTEREQPDPPDGPVWLSNAENSAWQSGWSSGWQAARSLDSGGRAQEPVAWMVGKDPQSAAVYNAGEKDEAFDAARRWKTSITGLVPSTQRPQVQLVAEVGEMVNAGRHGFVIHTLTPLSHELPVGTKLYACLDARKAK